VLNILVTSWHGAMDLQVAGVRWSRSYSKRKIRKRNSSTQSKCASKFVYRPKLYLSKQTWELPHWRKYAKWLWLCRHYFLRAKAATAFSAF